MKQKTQALLSKFIIIELIFSIIIIMLGYILFIYHHGFSISLTQLHVFTGEPQTLTHPLNIFKTAFEKNDLSIIQLGLLCLLFNPFMRAVFLFFDFALIEKNKHYTFISALVCFILIFSFFY